MANNTIREAENNVKIEGILKEINLEEKNDIINGSVVIQTDDKSEHTIFTYVKKNSKNGTENKAYKGLQTLINEYVSVAKLMEEGKSHNEAMAEATKVRVTRGRLDRQEFYTTNGEFVSNICVTTNYFNRITDDSFAPKAEFEVECYFDKIRKEIKGDEETGRLIIEGIVPLYGGKVLPMEFVAEGGVADYIEDNYTPKKTGMVWGDVINNVERSVVKKSGFGKDKEEVKVNYKRELLITGGKEEQYEEDDVKTFTTEQIQAAWKVRETETLPALLKKYQDKNRVGGSTNTTSSKETPKFTF